MTLASQMDNEKAVSELKSRAAWEAPPLCISALAAKLRVWERKGKGVL